jgi:hypothetical protein
MMTAGAAVMALAFGGCGGDDEKKAESEAKATPAQAIAEIGKVRDGLAAALVTYKAGDEKKADEQVGDAYLEHFEIVEGPLGTADHELNEKLEETIRDDLRAKMKAGAPVAEVEQLVTAIQADLVKGEAALR